MSLARTRVAARLLIVAALAALTAGCFQPMYAEHSDGTPALREKLRCSGEQCNNDRCRHHSNATCIRHGRHLSGENRGISST